MSRQEQRWYISFNRSSYLPMQMSLTKLVVSTALLTSKDAVSPTTATPEHPDVFVCKIRHFRVLEKIQTKSHKLNQWPRFLLSRQDEVWRMTIQNCCNPYQVVGSFAWAFIEIFGCWRWAGIAAVCWFCGTRFGSRSLARSQIEYQMSATRKSIINLRNLQSTFWISGSYRWESHDVCDNDDLR